jgi:hypothetical protein
MHDAAGSQGEPAASPEGSKPRPERSRGFVVYAPHIVRPAMTQTTKPTKEQVRELMERRTHEESPPPTPEEIRRELGWHLIQSNGPVQEVPE